VRANERDELLPARTGANLFFARNFLPQIPLSRHHRHQFPFAGVFALQFHHDNICTSADGRFYSFADCNATSNNFNTTCYNTQNNTLYVDAGASFEQDCARALGFTEWQNFGQDSGSATAATPPIAQLIALGAAKVLGGLEG
jgi:hypothetical protein